MNLSNCFLASIICLAFNYTNAYCHSNKNQEWQSLSGEAYYVAPKDKKEALQLYRQAMDKAKLDQAPEPVLLDLRLSEAEVLISLGRLDEAESILKSCYEKIESSSPDSLRILRYWRRCLHLARERKDNSSALAAQAQIVKIIGERFERGSLVHIEELKKEQDLLITVNQWNKAAEIDQEFLQLAKSERIDYIRSRLEGYRKTFHDIVENTALAPGQIGKPEFDLISKTCPEPHVQLAIWKRCIIEHRISRSIRDLATARIVVLLRRLGEFASNEELAIEARARSPELFERLAVKSRNTDAKTEAIAHAAYNAIKNAPTSRLDDLVLKVQLVSIYAMILADRGKVDTAISIIDSLVIPPNSIVNHVDLVGVLQARYCIAEICLKENRRLKAKEQLELLKILLGQQNRLSTEEKSKFTNIWYWTEMAKM